MRPEHYSRDIAQRCGSLVRHLLPLVQNGLPDDANYGGPLDTTFLLAMATPMVVIPIERLYNPEINSAQVADDREIDEVLSKRLRAFLGDDKKFADAPFGVSGWSYVACYHRIFNLADGCPDDLLQALASDEAVACAKATRASVILRVLRNALAHGGVVYLDKDGRATEGPAAMYAFVSTERKQREVIGLNVLRIRQADFCAFLTAWTDWLTRSAIST